MNWKPVSLLTVSHLLIDLCQGMVPALLPFLMEDVGLSYAAGAGLVFATSAASSVIQPIFGLIADRTALRWLLPASVVLTGAGLAVGAQSSSYTLFFAALSVSGLGVAAFHPEAARQVHLAAGPGRSTEMSLFAFGGGLGFALAPLLTAILLVWTGRAGTLLLLVPTGILAVLLAGRFSLASAARVLHAGNQAAHDDRGNDWTGFLVLSIVTICRSTVFVGLNTFLALYWMSQWSAAPSVAATILGLFLGVGLCGTLLGGHLADRFGHRAILRIGFAGAAVFLPLLLAAPGNLWAVVLLVILAVTFFTPSSLLVVLGQGYLPKRIGVASGVTLGLAVSVGGMMAPALGLLADRQGVTAVMYAVEGFLVAAVLLSLVLPQARQQPVPQQEAVKEETLSVVETASPLETSS
jgi:FSR family fosmidomycin resistance protein-like MFS transporter